ncbi:MAG: hypothetical protein NC247_02045 [Ruminococcus flavefaciens]|nr:hypothetical protein [Ruminococcus flavefaciens]
MRLLIKERQSNKTTGMLFTSEATGYPIVVQNYARKRQLCEHAKNIGVMIPDPITVKDIKDNRETYHKNVLIDEAYDIITEALNCYLGTNVVAATISDKVKDEYEARTSK